MQLSGLIPNLGAEVYYPAPMLSQTRLKWLRESAATYRYNCDHPGDETKAMLLGRVFHHMLFTPKDPIWWIVRPEGLDLRTSDGKEWKKNQPQGVPLVEWKDFGWRRAMCESAWAHEDSRKLLEGGRFEVSLFGHEPILGASVEANVKARLDIEGMTFRNNWLADFKSCESAKDHAFSNYIEERGLHLQAAWYTDIYERITGEKKDVFLFVAIENKPPHNLKVYQLAQKDLDDGREEYHRLLEKLVECRDADQWPGYQNGITVISRPRWATNEPKVLTV